jgi:probable rRNA maturation factor
VKGLKRRSRASGLRSRNKAGAVRRIPLGTLIPRDDGKRIEELVGAVHTKTDSHSVAKMLAPPLWREPEQTPEFDETVIVLRGRLTLASRGRTERISAGELGLVPRGRPVIYRNDGREACEYYSICVPAFRPERAHMDAPTPFERGNRVLVDARHRGAKPLTRWLVGRAQSFLKKLALDGRELSVLLVGDAEIRKLNRQWRAKDKATDVLSFPAGELPAGTPGFAPLGDVVISLDTAARQAKERKVGLRQELELYLVHGALHLLGHDHERPHQAKVMAALEDRLLGSSGMIARSRSLRDNLA